MLTRISVAVITLLLACSLAGAEMYQWVDEDGVVTFKDSPPPASKKRKKVKAYSDSDFDPAPSGAPASSNTRSPKANGYAASSAAAKSRRFDGVIEIFLTDWCGHCKKAKKYMDANGIRYVAYDIEKDSAAQRRFQDLGGRGVPLILIGSQRMSGFSPEALEHYMSMQ